jgi:hypothetical protein
VRVVSDLVPIPAQVLRQTTPKGSAKEIGRAFGRRPKSLRATQVGFPTNFYSLFKDLQIIG